MSKLRYNDVKDKPTDEMSSAEARLQIQREVGLNKTPYHPFGKGDLNSIYRFFTGEFYFPTDKLGTSESPPSGLIRAGIAEERELDYTDEDQANDRPFRRAQLRALADDVRNTSDRRQ